MNRRTGGGSGAGDESEPGLPLARSLHRLREETSRRLGVDVRALAALRVSLGLLLLADLAVRAQDLVAFYTDAGVLPRAALAEQFPAFAAASIHTLSGDAWFQVVLFGIAGVVAGAMTLGYRTRLATVASLLLLVSLHARNPVLLNAGDSLLRRLLFWGLFLPLGARWSVDSLRQADGDSVDRAEDDGRRRTSASAGRTVPREWVASVATAALLLQVVIVYTMNATFKLQGERWLAGEAIRYVFGLDHLTVLFGDALAAHPDLLVAADRLWLAMILGSVLLVLLTGRARTALVAAFVAAHLGMVLTLRLGLFPLISIAALLPFLPAPIWGTVESRLSRMSRTVRGSVDTDHTAAQLGRAGSRPATPSIPPGVYRMGNLVVPAVVAVLLALVLVWNAATIGVVDLPDGVESTVDPKEYRWDMFAPEPRSTDGWYVVPGRLESGRQVDAFRGGSVEWGPPPEAAETFPSHRWFVYLLDLRGSAYADLRPYFAEYLCRQWNGAHADELRDLTVYYVERPVQLDGPGPTRRVELVSHACESV